MPEATATAIVGAAAGQPALRGRVRHECWTTGIAPAEEPRRSRVDPGRHRRTARPLSAEDKALSRTPRWSVAPSGPAPWPRSADGRGVPSNGTCASSSGRSSSCAERPSSVARENEYRFRHVLVRDVAYGQIPRARRGETHRRTAEWLETLSPDRADDRAEMLAHHYVAAFELARAKRAWRPTSSGKCPGVAPERG